MQEILIAEDSIGNAYETITIVVLSNDQGVLLLTAEGFECVAIGSLLSL